MTRERLDKFCEWGILGLVLAMLIYGPLATGAVRTPDFLVLQGLTLGVVALWCVRLAFSPRPVLLWTPICWVVLLFLGYALIRYFTADLEYVARQELSRCVLYAVIFFAVLNNLHRQSAVQIVLVTLIILATCIAAYGIYQFATKSDRVWNFITPYRGRATGTYISPNHLAGFLEMILPLALALVLASRLKLISRVFLGYACVVIAAGIALTLSRGGWLAILGALTVFWSVLLFQPRLRLQAIIAFGLLLGIGIVLAPKLLHFKERIEQSFLQGKINDPRFHLWSPTVRMWQDHFWWGVGPGHFDHRFRAYRPVEVQQRPDRAHNDFLNTLADWGIVGASIVAGAWFCLAAGALKTWRALRSGRDEKPGNKLAAVLGISIGLLAILLHAMVDFNFHIPANALVAITLMALLSSHLRFATERYWRRIHHGRFVALALLALAGGALACNGWRAAGEYVWLSRSEKKPPFSNEQIADLKRAFTIEPDNFETSYAIGEAYRIQSWEANPGFETLTRAAMVWYERGMKLNPYDAYNYLRYGMCLHWLEQHDRAERYFHWAERLDPNGYYTVAHIGWHYVQTGRLAIARDCFERSWRLEWHNNTIAESYLKIIEEKLTEAATGHETLH